LEDLQALGLSWCEKGHADSWYLTDESRGAVQALFKPKEELEDTFSEMSEGSSYTE
jgi:hypothetical protein